MEFMYLLLLIYLTLILFYLNEKTFIIIAFIIYIGSDVLRTIYPITMGGTHNLRFGIALGTLTFISTIYLFIATFKIKSSFVTLPYRLFGFGLLTSTLLKLIITIIFPLIVDFSTLEYSGLVLLRTIMNFVNVLSLLTPISVLLLIRELNKFLTAEIVQNADISS